MMKRNNNYMLGQSLIEFAITIPLLLILLVGIFDLGRASFYYSAITNSAREGARYGIINPDGSTAIKDIVKDYSFGIDPDDLDITVTIDPILNTITVNVNYKFIPATPLIASLLGGETGIVFETETTMTIEG